VRSISVRDYGDSDAVYLPLTYRRIASSGPLPRKIFSHIRVLQPGSAKGEVATFEINHYGRTRKRSRRHRRICHAPHRELRRDRELPRAGRDQRDRLRRRAACAISTLGPIPRNSQRKLFFKILLAPLPSGFLVLPQPVEAYADRPTGATTAEAPSEEDTGKVENLLADWWRELLGVGRRRPRR